MPCVPPYSVLGWSCDHIVTATPGDTTPAWAYIAAAVVGSIIGQLVVLYWTNRK